MRKYLGLSLYLLVFNALLISEVNSSHSKILKVNDLSLFSRKGEAILGPSDDEIRNWKESLRNRNSKILQSKITKPRLSTVKWKDPELVPLRTKQLPDDNPDNADGFETIIDYTRPLYGQFIFREFDSLGVWFRPRCECKILKVQVLFSDHSGMLGQVVDIGIHDVPDTLFPVDSSQSLYLGNGQYGFYYKNKIIPSPQGELLGKYPLTVSKVGFDLTNGWCEVDLTQYGEPIDVGTRDFFVSFQFPAGNDDSTDVYYGPGDEQHGPGDYHGFKYYPTGSTYSPGIPNWVSRLNFTLRVVVEYNPPPMPVISDINPLSSVYYSCNPGPYEVSATVYNYGDTLKPYSEKVELIYFQDNIWDADTIDITSNYVELNYGKRYTGWIPPDQIGAQIWYCFRAEFTSINNLGVEEKYSIRSSLASFKILEANPDANILVIQDGSTADVEMYTDVLINRGWIYDVWNTTNYGEPSLCELQKYSSIFWLQGQGTSGDLGLNLDSTIVPDYLDAGGNLFLVSADYIGVVEGDNFTGEWTAANYPFITDYLKVAQFSSDANQDANDNSTDSLYIGEADNAISGFLGTDTLWLAPMTKYAEFTGGKYNWADEVTPFEMSGVGAPFRVFSASNDDWVTASTMYNGTYKMVFLPFYLEAALNTEQFNTIVKNVLDFFGEKVVPVVVIESGPRYAVAANSGPYTVIASATDGDGTISGMELGTSTNSIDFTYTAMTMAEGKYTSEIATIAVDDTLFYEVCATDNEGLKGYAGPWAFNKVDFTPAKTLLYCGDDPYDRHYKGKVDSIVVASLERVASGKYDYWDVDTYGPPSYIGFLDGYNSVIWHGYADWTETFPEATADNPFYPFVQNGGNICFSSEEKVASSHFDDGSYSPVAGEAAYDVLGIGWIGYDYSYDSIKVVGTDPLVAGMDANIKLEELPFGYMGELFDPVNYGVEGNAYILDAWLADYGGWYGYWDYGLAWKEDFGSKKVIVPFALAALNDKNRDAFLDNVIEWFGTGNAIQREPDALPTTFALKQNYPNPFNPVTTIRYELPNQENVHLTIYNTLGQKVRTLVSEQRTAGRYAVVWDGKDDAGRLVGSGIYFYRIRAENFDQTKKMILLR